MTILAELTDKIPYWAVNLLRSSEEECVARFHIVIGAANRPIYTHSFRSYLPEPLLSHEQYEWAKARVFLHGFASEQVERGRDFFGGKERQGGELDDDFPDFPFLLIAPASRTFGPRA